MIQTSRKIFFYDTEFMESGYNNLELISFAAVDLQGTKQIYVCNSEADLSKANLFVRENVLPHLLPVGDASWVTISEMRDLLFDFFAPTIVDRVELWGYYPAYDHVLLCGIFGTMAELPPGMPLLTLDLKQWAMELGDPSLPPKPPNVHDALADAKWTREAYQFLASYEKANGRRD